VRIEQEILAQLVGSQKRQDLDCHDKERIIGQKKGSEEENPNKQSRIMRIQKRIASIKGQKIQRETKRGAGEAGDIALSEKRSRIWDPASKQW